jgi:hypothetical protein
MAWRCSVLYQIYRYLKGIGFYGITEFIVGLGLLIIIVIDLAEFILFKLKR